MLIRGFLASAASALRRFLETIIGRLLEWSRKPPAWPTARFGYHILHVVVLKEFLCWPAARLFHIDFKSTSWFYRSKSLMDRFHSMTWSNMTGVLELFILQRRQKTQKKPICDIFSEIEELISAVTGWYLESEQTQACICVNVCMQKGAEDGTLTTGGGKGRAALRGHPQICWACVKHHVEHLGRRADADFPKILSLMRRKPKDNVKHETPATSLTPEGMRTGPTSK